MLVSFKKTSASRSDKRPLRITGSTVDTDGNKMRQISDHIIELFVRATGYGHADQEILSSCELPQPGREC